MKRTCEGCKFLVKIVGHPWNTPGSFTFGSLSELKCYGCAVGEESNTVVLFDSIFAGCEMYTEVQSASRE